MRTLIFDLETQRLASEVGGWDHVSELLLSVAVTYDCQEDRFLVFREADVQELLRELRGADRVVGFNVLRFDYRVLQHYDPQPIHTPTLDMLQEIERRHGHRVSLQSLAEGCFGTGGGKIASGLDAVRWWREGRIDSIIEYCREDVRVTRDVYRFGASRGYVLARSPRDGANQRLAVSWPGETEVDPPQGR